jgi:hypothetical protein
MAHQKRLNPLRSWGALNEHLIKVQRLEVAEELLQEEISGNNRENFIVRIHQRVCSLRAKGEREVLVSTVKKRKKQK